MLPPFPIRLAVDLKQKLSIGTLIGCLLAAPLSDRFGRKTCIPFWCIIFCIGVTIQMAVGKGQWLGIAFGEIEYPK